MAAGYKTPWNIATQRLQLTSNHLTAPVNSRSLSYSTVDSGSKYSVDYKKYLTDTNGNVKSFMHDVPLDLDTRNGTATMVVEIPRWSYAKFEINTKLEGNPITQDIKKGNVRFVKNLFPFHGYVHNYGALPQTWEDATNSNGSLGLYGDNDPLDVVEIGSQVLDTGAIERVKVLGSLALIDDGELDWKVVVVRTADQLASQLHDIADVQTICPGLLEATREWFRNYKIPDGKPANQFAFNGEFKNREETIRLVQENHEAWDKLVHGHIKADAAKLPNIANTSVSGSLKYQEAYDHKTLSLNPSTPDMPLPEHVDRMYYCGSS
ncbi:inorganic pyrophosphatase [Yamadazyma tenuis]|uniref:inorganic diphosphatase n=1 Tax=Candida tenuis (strain ATCC 10573 / BCRC 21748 / CBS 615 / JCM 9827 / NBRC 10315 / NRRL Y-1498 / VKM Y-70) TaxID=590646 RepID=G3BET0_CANTC|nr:inorganic pyrophosphatase [Yamadazyma tenuis ATCC 10573]EGV60585.1 inorganic pyrophosphatase [Yamadazyma tenuis ATCC 10573]WEJ94168.1 inorganic pyrophosphatase [Yamadazyma tenuis]